MRPFHRLLGLFAAMLFTVLTLSGVYLSVLPALDKRPDGKPRSIDIGGARGTPAANYLLGAFILGVMYSLSGTGRCPSVSTVATHDLYLTPSIPRQLIVACPM